MTVRLHSACLTGDLFGSLKCDCGDQLRGDRALHGRRMAAACCSISTRKAAATASRTRSAPIKLQSQGWDTYDADEMLGFGLDQRRFDFAAEMLKQLGVARVLDHDQQPPEDRCPGACGARGGRGSARPWPADGRERALPRIEARPGRPFHRSRRSRRATSPSGTERIAGRARPMMRRSLPGRAGSRLWPSLGSCSCSHWLILSWPWLSGALHDAVGRQGAFPGAAPVPRGQPSPGRAAVLEPLRLRGLAADRRSRRSLIFSPPHLLLALLIPRPAFQLADGWHSPCCSAEARCRADLPGSGLALAGASSPPLPSPSAASAAWRIQHTGQILSLCCFPLALLAADPGAGRARAGAGFFAGVVAGMMVLGRDQVAWLGVYVLAGSCVWHWFGPPPATSSAVAARQHSPARGWRRGRRHRRGGFRCS